MSRVAKNPVAIPAKVEVVLSADLIAVSGPMGKLSQPLTDAVRLVREGDAVTVAAANDSQHSRAMSGTVRALVANMVQGVSQGFTRKLTLVGVGYKAQAQGAALNLDLGYSHPIRNRPQGCGQAGGGSGRRADSRIPQAGALQGQGRALCR
jgi:large subunit ribosomal protein L6